MALIAEPNMHRSIISSFKSGELGEPSRRLLPGVDLAWQGGILKFTVKVDLEKQNYFTIRLWGG